MSEDPKRPKYNSEGNIPRHVQPPDNRPDEPERFRSNLGISPESSVESSGFFVPNPLDLETELLRDHYNERRKPNEIFDLFQKGLGLTPADLSLYQGKTPEQVANAIISKLNTTYESRDQIIPLIFDIARTDRESLYDTPRCGAMAVARLENGHVRSVIFNEPLIGTDNLTGKPREVLAFGYDFRPQSGEYPISQLSIVKLPKSPKDIFTPKTFGDYIYHIRNHDFFPDQNLADHIYGLFSNGVKPEYKGPTPHISVMVIDKFNSENPLLVAK